MNLVKVESLAPQKFSYYSYHLPVEFDSGLCSGGESLTITHLVINKKRKKPFAYVKDIVLWNLSPNQITVRVTLPLPSEEIQLVQLPEHLPLNSFIKVQVESVHEV